MKNFISAIILILAFSPSIKAVSNEVFEDIKSLRKIGFELINFDQEPKGVTSFTLIVPKEFAYKDGENLYEKPFSGVSFIQTLNKVKHGPMLIGSPSSHFKLQGRKNEEGRYQYKLTVLESNVETSYIAVSFVHDGGGDWPMIVHIPLSSIFKQLEAEKNTLP